MYTANLPTELAAVLEEKREPGEQLLWTGRPAPLRAVRGEWGLFVFAIPWTAFALFWETMVIGFGTKSTDAPPGVPWMMALFGLPFIAIGIGLLSAPFVAMAKARGTVYAVTNKRVLFLTRKGGKYETHSLVPQYVGDLRSTERGDGSGDLTLVAAPQYGATSAAEHTRFFGIPGVREVERIVRETFFPGGYSATAAPPTFGVGDYRGTVER